jgi:imidazole glycerol-phosphate synthase subunit HisF
MLKTRVIPTLLWKDVGLVKGIGFDSWRRVGSVMPAVKVYQLRDVDELIVMDITATAERRALDYAAVAELAEVCRVPLTVGGGIRDLAMIRRLLQTGADKVAINSAAYDDLELISSAASIFGSQCIVASVDARKTDRYECFRNCGSKPTGWEVGRWVRELQRAGAGEILVTSIERDGTMIGYDIDLIRSVTDAVSIPVIASGGAGEIQHFGDAIQIANASAVAAASIFHFTACTPAEIKSGLAQRGIAVRGVATAKFNSQPVLSTVPG